MGSLIEKIFSLALGIVFIISSRFLSTLALSFSKSFKEKDFRNFLIIGAIPIAILGIILISSIGTDFGGARKAGVITLFVSIIMFTGSRVLAKLMLKLRDTTLFQKIFRWAYFLLGVFIIGYALFSL